MKDSTDMLHNTTDVSRDTTVDVTTAAELLGISEEAVRARIRRGKLEAEKVGALWRVHLPDGESVVSPNATVLSHNTAVPSHNTTSRHRTEHVVEYDTTSRDIDLEPLAAVIRDQNHRLEELAAAAAFWQVRALQAEEQLKAITAGGDVGADAGEEPETATEALELPPSNDPEPTGILAWWKRLWGA